MKVDVLIQKLEDVAKKNNDEFEYVCYMARGRKIFSCRERADGHEFLWGDMSRDDVEIDQQDIDDACESWGYEKL